MSCWEPEFWHSKFTDQITTGADQEVLDACGKFADAVQEARKGYREADARRRKTMSGTHLISSHYPKKHINILFQRFVLAKSLEGQ